MGKIINRGKQIYKHRGIFDDESIMVLDALIGLKKDFSLHFSSFSVLMNCVTFLRGIEENLEKKMKFRYRETDYSYEVQIKFLGEENDK